MINACDAGREGELFTYIYELAKSAKPGATIMDAFHDQSIKEAFANLRDADQLQPPRMRPVVGPNRIG